jgi:uncharacterized protein (UPF0210 family)
MKIRSITCFYHPAVLQADEAVNRLKLLAASAKQRFEDNGVEVQSIRLATVPFPEFLPILGENRAVKLIQHLEKAALEAGFTRIAIGPAHPDIPQSFDLVLPILAATQKVYITAQMAGPIDGVNLRAVKACGRIIHDAATLVPGNSANLRFAALANVAPFAPFYPVAFSQGPLPAFSMAVQCADEVLKSFKMARTLAQARQMLLDKLNQQASKLSVITSQLEAETNVKFRGFDFSPAPNANEACSLGEAMERLGVPSLGGFGSLSAAAFIADALDRGNWQHIGFNGLMLPVLEDLTLSERAAQGTLTVKDLLMYSAVCGTGLDAIPLPGDTPPEQISAVLTDLASLSLRLNKPLAARLLPVPGKKAGDMTDFQIEYFTNTRVLSIAGPSLTGLLASDEAFTLNPRK